MNKSIIKYTLGACLMALSAWIGWESHSTYSDIESHIYKQAEVALQKEAWGDLTVYTDEASTSTFGTENTLTALAEIKPGEQIHPPHQHTAEEFMFIVEGSGTWSLNGKESPAQAGDVMYAKPWDWHGISNTGKTTLKFFVMKWDSKGVEAPKKQE